MLVDLVQHADQQDCPAPQPSGSTNSDPRRVVRGKHAVVVKQSDSNACSAMSQVPIFTETLDVRDQAKVESLPERLPQEFAEVDILVNNAGLALGTAPVTEISTEVGCYD